MYVLNEVDRVLTRYPRETMDREWDVSALRKDRQAIPYELGEPLEVGKRATFLLRIREDGVITVRTTTPVMSIDGQEAA